MNLDDIKTKQRHFVQERKWEKFHTVGNLCKAISVEAAELLEITLWERFENIEKITEKELDCIKEEIADIMLYSISLCSVLDLNVIDIMHEKIIRNEKKYPACIYQGKYRLD